MFERTASRRGVLKGIGATATTAVGGIALSGSVGASSQWTAVTSPTDGTIHDVVCTQDTPYAVAASGIVLQRTSNGWQTVLSGGPTGNGNNLYGADVTKNGKRLWFCGSSGAIGEYNVKTGTLTDRSNPKGSGSNFNDIAVTGKADEANVYVGSDSGEMYSNFKNGKAQEWNVTKPGSGAAINAVDFHDTKSGRIVDGNKSTFETDDGETWDKIGIAGADVNLYGIDSDAANDAWVCGGGGTIFDYDGVDWTPTDTGDADLRDIEVDSGTGYSVGSGGKIYELASGTWTENTTPVGENLKAVIRCKVDIATGASGTILER